jgi:hypothetical protein
MRGTSERGEEAARRRRRLPAEPVRPSPAPLLLPLRRLEPNLVELRVWRFGRWTTAALVASLVLGMPVAFGTAAFRSGPLTESKVTNLWSAIALAGLIYLVVALSWVTVNERGITIATCGLGRRHPWSKVTSVAVVLHEGRVRRDLSPAWWRSRNQVAVEVVVGDRTRLPFATRRLRLRPVPEFSTDHDDVEDLSDLAMLANRYLATGGEQ